jgi:hypothetical protein
MYRIESIGRVFTNKTREQLEQRLTAEAEEGWYFHSVFSVTETSCAGFDKSNHLTRRPDSATLPAQPELPANPKSPYGDRGLSDCLRPKRPKAGENLGRNCTPKVSHL